MKGVLVKSKNKIRQPKTDVIIDIFIYITFIIAIILVVLPMLNLFALAFSEGEVNSAVTFIPMVGGTSGATFGFSFKAFEYVFEDGGFFNSFKNTIIITLVVTIFSNLLMALAAYPLSKPDFPFKKIIMTFFIITMLFSAGVVPSYLLMSSMQLTEKISGVILMSISNVFNLLLFKTTFEGLPKELEEAATIDGAGSFRLFFNIIIPMALPTFATCCFFTIVSCINSYGGALLLIRTNDAAKPMALYIYELLNIGSSNITDPFFMMNQQNIQAATIVLSIIPILIIYPFIFRYIKSGLTIGSVKG